MPEATTDSDPLELVGNQFYLHQARYLYLDRHEDGPDGVLQWISDIDEINALPDIPVISGNTAFVDP